MFKPHNIIVYSLLVSLFIWNFHLSKSSKDELTVYTLDREQMSALMEQDLARLPDNETRHMQRIKYLLSMDRILKEIKARNSSILIVDTNLIFSSNFPDITETVFKEIKDDARSTE